MPSLHTCKKEEKVLKNQFQLQQHNNLIDKLEISPAQWLHTD